MEYRKLPKGDEQISVLGPGTSSIRASSEKEIEETVALAVEKEKTEKKNPRRYSASDRK